MEVKIQAILMRFPEYSEKILRQISENEELRNICTDYEMCIELMKSPELQSELKRSEWEECLEIKTELEQELLKYLRW